MSDKMVTDKEYEQKVEDKFAEMLGKYLRGEISEDSWFSFQYWSALEKERYHTYQRNKEEEKQKLERYNAHLNS